MRFKEKLNTAADFHRINAQKHGIPAPDATPAGQAVSPLEVMFAALWAEHHPTLPPEREHNFMDGRKYAFDFAWPLAMVAVECDGGQGAAKGGRHNTDEDRWKLNKAAALGWIVLRFSRAMLEDEPDSCMQLVMRAIESAAKEGIKE